jgi:hypothetical protein
MRLWQTSALIPLTLLSLLGVVTLMVSAFGSEKATLAVTATAPVSTMGATAAVDAGMRGEVIPDEFSGFLAPNLLVLLDILVMALPNLIIGQPRSLMLALTRPAGSLSDTLFLPPPGEGFNRQFFFTVVTHFQIHFKALSSVTDTHQIRII